jgi:hypothetical protein
MLQPPGVPHHVGPTSIGMPALLVLFALVLIIWGFYRLRM